MHTKAPLVACVFAIVIAALDVGAADGASVSAAFSPGSASVTLPKMESNHRLYLRASANQATLIRALRVAGVAYSIGQFRVPGPIDSGTEAPLIPLTDAAGRPIVLTPNGTSFGANVSYVMDLKAAPLPNLMELVAVATSENPSPVYVAWVEPPPSSLGVAPGTSIVVEIAPGESTPTSSQFFLNDRSPSPGPTQSPRTDSGRVLNYRPPQELTAGRHSVLVDFKSFGRSEQFSWVFDVGPGPALSVENEPAGSLVVNFLGRLESAPSPDGPFVAVPGATSPHRVSTTEGVLRFFRAVP